MLMKPEHHCLHTAQIVLCSCLIRDLSQNENLYIICCCLWIQTTIREVSFIPDGINSYISFSPVNIGERFDMSMRFRTFENDGLLSYVADDMKTQVLIRKLIL